MSLGYIFGPAGSGKTSLILEDIVAHLNTGKNLIYIVPEQFSLHSEYILSAKDKRLILEAQVLSFNRLAYHVFSEVGFIKRKNLDECSKRMLLRRIIADLGNELGFLGKTAGKPGFIDNLSQIITEFYQYGVKLPALVDVTADMPETLMLKMRDLTKIYSKYTDYLGDHFISTDNSLDFLAEKIADSLYIEGSFIWLDGFYGFTPQEYKCLAALIKRAGKVTVALTVDSSETSYQHIAFSDPFYETKSTLNTLTRIAHDAGCKIEGVRFLNHAPHKAEAPEISHLIEYFFSYQDNRAAFRQKPENIIITGCANGYDEVTHAAKAIIRLVRDNGYRYRDIALLTGGASGYDRLIPGIFGQYGIPVFIDSKIDILSFPLTELIRAAVDIAAKNWSYESVFRFLKTGMTGVTDEDIYDLENYCLSYGIKSYKWKFDSWRMGASEFDLEHINAIKDKVVGILTPFAGALRPGTKLTVRELSIKLFELIASIGVAEACARMDHTQVWNVVCGMFDKMVDILGDELCSVKDYAYILDAGLKCVDMGVLPPSKDQVVVADSERSRLPDIRALLVLGANDGILPAVPKESGMLTDSDRASLADAGINLVDRRRALIDQELSIYSLLAKPSEYLEFSFARNGPDGRAINPSTFIARLTRLFPSLEINEEGDSFFVSAPGPMLAETGLRLHALVKDDAEHDLSNEPYKEMYAYFMSREPYARVLDKMKSLAFNLDYTEKLSREVTDKLYGKEIITSISRLERFEQCPFAYFVRFNLEARERKIYQVDSLDLGSLMHEILEEFTYLLDARGIAFKDLTEKDIGIITDEAISNIGKRPDKEIFFSTAANKYMINNVRRTAVKSIWALAEHIKRGDFTPYAAEMAFKADTPITRIELHGREGRSFLLTGRMDRIDVLDFNGCSYVKIIDYKSSGRRFDPNDVYYGMQLQLILYLDYFLKKQGDVKLLPGGIFYFNFGDPVINASGLDFTSPDPYDGLNEKILSEFRMTGLSLADVDIVRSMDRNIKTSSSVLYNVSLDNKSDTGFKNDSSVAGHEGFNELRDAAEQKVREIGEKMLDGNIDPRPFKKGDETGCRYCGYGGVCKFEAIEGENKYREIGKARFKQ